MNLYLIRHGPAERSSATGRDADRPLSEEGRALLTEASNGLRRAGFSPEVLLASPFRRAVETAEILAAGIDSLEVSIFDSLAPGATPAEILAGLRPHRNRPGIGLVGHQPDLAYLGSALIGAAPATNRIRFLPGTIACFECEALVSSAPAELVWILTPDHLRSLHSS